MAQRFITHYAKTPGGGAACKTRKSRVSGPENVTCKKCLAILERSRIRRALREADAAGLRKQLGNPHQVVAGGPDNPVLIEVESGDSRQSPPHPFRDLIRTKTTP